MKDFENPIIRAIKERTSTRAFQREQIQNEELDAILACAIAAPSGSNAQPWHFTVVQDRTLLIAINDDIHTAIDQFGNDYAKGFSAKVKDLFYDAPTVVFFSGDGSNRWAENDCGIASQNMMLAAHSLGIGSCVIGFARRLFEVEMGKKYLDLLDVPQGYKLLFGLSLGYVDVPTPPRSRRQDVISFR